VTRRLGPLLLTVFVAVGACSFGSNPYLPPANDSPLEVLTAYLEAYKGGQCGFGRQLWIDATPHTGDGDLCGQAQLITYRLNPDPATPAADIADFASTLTTNGSRDGSVQPGETIWFFELDRQADGAWRIRGGGSGP
jgi:hypothetical protein